MVASFPPSHSSHSANFSCQQHQILVKCHPHRDLAGKALRGTGYRKRKSLPAPRQNFSTPLFNPFLEDSQFQLSVIQACILF